MTVKKKLNDITRTKKIELPVELQEVIAILKLQMIKMEKELQRSIQWISRCLCFISFIIIYDFTLKLLS